MGGGRHRLRKTRSRRLRRRVIRIALVGCLALSALPAWVYWRVEFGTDHVSALALDDPSAHEYGRLAGSRIALLVGSDSRDGENAGLAGGAGEVTGARADTLLLAHLPAGDGQVILVSIPRDAYVTVPECGGPGNVVAEHQGRINGALAQGASCLVRTVQRLTALPVTDYLEVDFTGFTTVVDAIGGVPMTFPEPLRDQYADLDLPSGASVLSGEQALAFVRARHDLGDGSDLGRITRQQDFLTAFAGKLAESEVLLNPVRLAKLADSLARTTTVDEDMSVTDLLSLARGLQGRQWTFRAAPIASPDYDPATGRLHGGSRVLLDNVKGKELFEAIAAEAPLPAMS